jgi:6,7-dimethyl-8-ribityllumazine synthase
VQLTYHIPFAFEVLYVKNLKQAQARAGAKGNKGEEAAKAVLHALASLRNI